MIDEELYKWEYRESTAIVSGDDKISYKDLLGRASIVSAGLPRDRKGFVFLILEKGIPFIVSIIAVLRSGNAYVPVSPDHPRLRVLNMLEQAQPVAVITTRRYYENNPDLGGYPIFFAEDLGSYERSVHDGGEQSPRACRSSDDPAYVIFTSGSTGKPKGVIVSHSSLQYFVRTTISALHLRDDVRWLNVTPLYFDASLSDVFCTLSVGGGLVLQAPFLLPNEVLKRVESERVTHVLFTSSVLKLICSRFANLESFDFSFLRVLWYGGEPCPISILRKFKSACPHVSFIHGYGPTEVTHTTLWHFFTDLPDRDGFMPLGRPLPGVSAYVLTNNGSLARADEEGELYLGGPQLMLGYLAAPEQMRAALLPNINEPSEMMYRTGDFVRVDRDGNYIFCGRRDDLLKIRGILVHIAEVEAALLTVPFVDDAVVLAVDAGDDGKSLVAFVSSEQPSELCPPNLSAHLSRRLPAHMRPTFNVVMRNGQLPLLPHGKLDRVALAQNWREFVESTAAGAGRS